MLSGTSPGCSLRRARSRSAAEMHGRRFVCGTAYVATSTSRRTCVVSLGSAACCEDHTDAARPTSPPTMAAGMPSSTTAKGAVGVCWSCSTPVCGTATSSPRSLTWAGDAELRHHNEPSLPPPSHADPPRSTCARQHTQDAAADRWSRQRDPAQACGVLGRHTPKRLPWGSARWANSIGPLSTGGMSTVAPRRSAWAIVATTSSTWT